MSLRILFAIHGPPDPATAVFMNVSRRAGYLRRLGHEVDVWTPADLSFGRVPRLQPLLLPIELAARTLDAYDVVVFHSYLAWAWLRRARIRRRRPSAVIAFHGLEPLYHQAVAAELARTGEQLSRRFQLLHRVFLPRLLERACRRADRVLCLNQREKAFLEGERWAEPARVAVVPNGVEPELLVARVHRARASRLLFTGQWLRAKGTRYLTRAFEQIHSEHPDVELTCVGTGAEERVVSNDFAAHVRSAVRVIPRVTRAELARELTRADLFLFPSLSEGFSGALLEAVASGLPVVTTPSGAAPDLLTDGRSAVFVPAADAAALAGAVGPLLDDCDRRSRLGASAQEVARKYEWDRANAIFAAEITRAVECRHGR